MSFRGNVKGMATFHVAGLAKELFGSCNLPYPDENAPNFLQQCWSKVRRCGREMRGDLVEALLDCMSFVHVSTRPLQLPHQV